MIHLGLLRMSVRKRASLAKQREGNVSYRCAREIVSLWQGTVAHDFVPAIDLEDALTHPTAIHLLVCLSL
jgi:hypothetical protein